jgi:hypothetical protein
MLPPPVTVFHDSCYPFPNAFPIDRSIPFDGSDGLWRIIEIVVVDYDDGRNTDLSRLSAGVSSVQALEEVLRLSRIAEERRRRGRDRSEAAALQALEMLRTAPDDMGNLLIVMRLETDVIDVSQLRIFAGTGAGATMRGVNFNTIVFTGWLDKPLAIDGRLVGIDGSRWAPAMELPAGHARLANFWWEEGSPEGVLRDEVCRLLPPTLPPEHSSFGVVMSKRLVNLLAGRGVVNC